MRRADIVVVAIGALLGWTGSAVAQQPAKGPKPKLICKRMTETGSLVSRKKECRTREDWDRMAQSERAAGERLIDDNRPRFGIDQ